MEVVPLCPFRLVVGVCVSDQACEVWLLIGALAGELVQREGEWDRGDGDIEAFLWMLLVRRGLGDSWERCFAIASFREHDIRRRTRLLAYRGLRVRGRRRFGALGVLIEIALDALSAVLLFGEAALCCEASNGN